jgi:ABC-type tungstate transport system permease subunit
VNEREADAFAAWLTSDAARRLIASYRIEGERAFYLPNEAGREGTR